MNIRKVRQRKVCTWISMTQTCTELLPTFSALLSVKKQWFSTHTLLWVNGSLLQTGRYITTHEVDIYTSMYLENELHIRYSPICRVLSARHRVTHHHGGTDFKTWLACLCTGQWHRLWSVWGTLGTPVCTQLAGLMRVPSHQGSLQRRITQSVQTLTETYV